MESAILVGIPGAGKTTRAMDLIAKCCGAGLSLFDIGFLTYTRAARREASERACTRFNVPIKKLERRGWFRTIHSAVWKLLYAQKGDLVNGDNDWFKENLGQAVETENVEEGDWQDQFKGNNDVVTGLKIWDLARNRLCAVQKCYDELEQHAPWISADMMHHLSIIQRYEAAKRRDGRFDFTDLILRYAGWRMTPTSINHVPPEGNVPSVAAWFLDECQDTSALLDVAVRRLTSAARWTYLFGDPLQNIYQWAGSDPGKFLSWPVKKQQPLTKSWRCSAAVLNRAIAFIQQNNQYASDLRSLAIQPAKPGGVVETVWDDAWSSKVDPALSTLVMARTNRRALALGAELTSRGIPWKHNRLKVRFPQPARIRLAEAFDTLEHGGVIDREAWTDIIAAVPHELLAKESKMPRNQKASRKAIEFVTLNDIALDEAIGGTAKLAEIIGSGQWPSLLDAPNTSAWACKKRWGGLAEDPKVIVSTVHATKGMEAERVMLDTRITKPIVRQLTTEEGRDAERRVWYVGMTRARDYLCLIQGSGGPRLNYNELYDYL